MLKSIILFGIMALFAFSLVSCANMEEEERQLAPTALFDSLLTHPEKAMKSVTEFTHPPEEITFSSKVGDVVFPHKMHVEEFELECSDCHHNINAKKIDTPHSDYFKSSQINCQVCHTGSLALMQEDYNCSKCHHSNPMHIGKEKITAKVAIHKKCWSCHDMDTGKDASEECTFCHVKSEK